MKFVSTTKYSANDKIDLKCEQCNIEIELRKEQVKKGLFATPKTVWKLNNMRRWDKP